MEPMEWYQENRKWLIGARKEGWKGDTAGIGGALPSDDYQVFVSSDTVSRTFRVWAYGPLNELDLVVPYGDVQLEPGTIEKLPSGKLDPQNQPTVSWHGQQIKFLFKEWNPGGGAAPLMRAYTWIRLRVPAAGLRASANHPDL